MGKNLEENVFPTNFELFFPLAGVVEFYKRVKEADETDCLSKVSEMLLGDSYNLLAKTQSITLGILTLIGYVGYEWIKRG